MKPSNEKLLTEYCKTETDNNVEMLPPDGGWGYMIGFGSVIIMVLGAFPIFGFSIILSPILMTNEVSSVKSAWIFNLHALTYSFYALFVGPLCEEFGHRKVAFFGGVTVSISVVISAFAPSADFLFFSYGILGGIGGSSTISLCFLIVPLYFKKHRGFAISLTMMVGGTSALIAPIVANCLLENYGYKGASLIFAAIILNQCVGAMLYQPVEWHLKPAKRNFTIKNKLNEGNLSEYLNSDETKEEINKVESFEGETKFDASPDTIIQKNELKNVNQEKTYKNNYRRRKAKDIFLRVVKSTYKNFKSLKYMRVQFLSFASCGLVIAYTNFLMWMPFKITDAGYSIEIAAWCSSISSIGSFIGRIVSALISDRKFFNKRYGYMFGLFVVASSVLVFSFLQDIKFFLIVGIIWGIGIGFSTSLMITTMIDVMGMKMLPSVLGVSQLVKGTTGIILGTIIGAVRDATSSYMYSSWIMSGCAYIAFCLWLLMPFAEKFDRKIYKINEEN